MTNKHHAEILSLIQARSVKGTKHTFLDSYLGNTHPRYAIDAPALRTIAKEWLKTHNGLDAEAFAKLITSLVEAPSSTEKVMAGLLLDYATQLQKDFNPAIFDYWLEHLDGWAEVDALCTNKYTKTHLLKNWRKWKRILNTMAKSDDLDKKRASLVFLCTPLRHHTDDVLADQALKTIETLKTHKEVLITKAISWVLRSMAKYHDRKVKQYLHEHGGSLPKIALRETLVKLQTGKKTRKTTE